MLIKKIIRFSSSKNVFEILSNTSIIELLNIDNSEPTICLTSKSWKNDRDYDKSPNLNIKDVILYGLIK